MMSDDSSQRPLYPEDDLHDELSHDDKASNHSDVDVDVDGGNDAPVATGSNEWATVDTPTGRTYWGRLATDPGVGSEIDSDWPSRAEAAPCNLEPPKWGKKFIACSNAEAYIREVARAQGYGLAIKSYKADSYKEDGIVTPKRTARVYFSCSRGPMTESKAKVRKTTSIKNDCEFEVSINYHRRTDTWIITQNTKKPQKHVHNHPPVTAPNQLAYHRRFSPVVAQAVASMHNHGIAPRQIINLLDVREGSEPKLRDIYNATTQSRARVLERRISVEGLVDLLKETDWVSRERLGDDGTIKSLFLTSPDAISLARRYATVVEMDCTYKTNVFNLPLLHVVGSTCTHQSFTIALCFLNDETNPTYTWALKALAEVVYHRSFPVTFTIDAESALIHGIEVVFPDSTILLSQWHISQNLLQHCRPKMKTQANWEAFLNLWNAFVSSKNQQEYDSTLAPMSAFAEEYSCMEYINEIWMKHQKKFLAMYINKHVNFGYTVTPRIEGAHASLKDFLVTGNEDLLGRFESLKVALDYQSHDINVAIEMEKTKRIAHCPPFFDHLHGVISEFAVAQALKQWNMIDTAEPTVCTNAFRTSWGIPCSHDLMRLRGESDYLSPEHFILHWHLILPESTPESYRKLQERARVLFDRLMELPEHALRKVLHQIELLETGRFMLVPKTSANVETTSEGLPASALNKGKRPFYG